MKIGAPAKINLSLRVVGRRSDGFHELDTVMVPLALQDLLDIELTGEGISVRSSDETLPVDEENLAGRAVREYLTAINRAIGVSIRIEKAIPAEAGLGGGSSDAATALLGLNHLLGGLMTPESLALIAVSVGSDVPFFLDATARRCLGRGERMETPLGLTERPILVIKPPFGVSTAWAYRTYAAMGSPQAEGARVLDGVEVVNDLELSAFSKFTTLPLLKKDLAAHSETLAAGMSGSGSAMFAIMTSSEAVADLGRSIRNEYGSTYAVFETSTLRKGRESLPAIRT